MNQEKLESAKNLFFIALGVDIAVTALVLASDFWAIGVIKEIRAGGTAGESDFGTADFWASFSKVTLLTVVGVGWSLARWLGACYEYAKGQLKVTGFVHERWKVWGWLVPFMNIFKPYQVVSEIYKAGSSDVIGDGWKKTPASGLLLTWWIFWYIAHLVLWTLSKAAFRAAFRDDQTFNQILDNYYGSVAACVISLIVAALWFLVAGHLTRRLLDRQRIGLTPILQGQPIAVSQPVPPRNPAPTEPTASSSGSTQLSARLAAGTTSQAATNAVQFVDQAQTPTPMPLSESTEEDFWATAMTEVETGQRRAGIWAKAFAESDGDETKAKVAYLKARVQQLTDAANALAAQQEVERLEAIEKAQGEALATEQEIKKLVAQFESTGELSRQDLKFLIDRGPMAWLVKLRSYDLGSTLLHLCAKNEMIDEVNALLMAGADPYRSNNSGIQPEFSTNDEFVRWLIREGSLPPAKLRKARQLGISMERNAFCYAEFRYERLDAAIEYAEKLQKSPDAGLLDAVINGNWSAAKNLLENGAKPTGFDEENKSLLDHAKSRNDKLMISLLESYGST